MDNAALYPAAQILLSIVPIVGITIGGLVIFFFLLWRNAQISLLIKKDKYNPKPFDLKIFSLLTGTLLVGIGSVLSIIFALVDGVSYQLLGGLIPLACGISLLVFFAKCKNI